MKVILKETIDTLGIAGSECDVAPGYGRNYLIPQGKAVPATAQNIASAVAAQVEWAEWSGTERGRVLRRAAEIMRRYFEFPEVIEPIPNWIDG